MSDGSMDLAKNWAGLGECYYCDSRRERHLMLHCCVDGNDWIEIVALVGSTFVGKIGLQCVGSKSASVRQLFVRADYRGQGIGSRLVDRCCAIAEKAGCESLGLIIDAKNLRVKPLYERLGFRVCYEYDDSGDLLMARVLDGTHSMIPQLEEREVVHPVRGQVGTLGEAVREGQSVPVGAEKL